MYQISEFSCSMILVSASVPKIPYLSDPNYKLLVLHAVTSVPNCILLLYECSHDLQMLSWLSPENDTSGDVWWQSVKIWWCGSLSSACWEICCHSPTLLSCVAKSNKTTGHLLVSFFQPTQLWCPHTCTPCLRSTFPQCQRWPQYWTLTERDGGSALETKWEQRQSEWVTDSDSARRTSDPPWKSLLYMLCLLMIILTNCPPTGCPTHITVWLCCTKTCQLLVSFVEEQLEKSLWENHQHRAGWTGLLWFVCGHIQWHYVPDKGTPRRHITLLLYRLHIESYSWEQGSSPQ